MTQDDLDRYARMARRARERREQAAAHTQADLTARFGEPVDGENPYVEQDHDSPHYGHRTHIHPSHGNQIRCSCGGLRPGGFSFVLDAAWEAEAARPCPVCTARGVTST